MIHLYIFDANTTTTTTTTTIASNFSPFCSKVKPQS